MIKSSLLAIQQLKVNHLGITSMRMTSAIKMSTTTEATHMKTSELATPENPLDVHDYFGVHKLFTVKDLFNSRVHYGHTVKSLEPSMRQFVYGTRFGQCIIDLDQTAELMRHALNFTAHIAYKGGIVMFVCRQPHLVHLVDKTAMECGEYSFTRPWKTEVFCAPNVTFQQEIRLPDVVIMVHTKDSHQYTDHKAIVDAAKVFIPTVGIVDTDCNPNIITFPVPGNDDTLESVQLYLNLFKRAILIGKEKRKEEL